MGNAMYDMKGLTFQGHLNQFWQSDFKPDSKLFKKYRLHLLTTTQINAVYYGYKKEANVQAMTTAEAGTEFKPTYFHTPV
jgi:capsular polysaccharide export protein